MHASKLRLIVWMWSLFAIAFLASKGSEMSEPQSLMLLPHSFFSPVSWQASCTEEAETKLLPVMTEGNTEKKEVRPLPVKEHSHPSEILLLLAFVLQFQLNNINYFPEHKGKAADL